jgi:hypothetical protein
MTYLFLYSPAYSGVMKEDEMGGKCSKNGKHVKSVQNFSRETCREETTWKT